MKRNDPAPPPILLQWEGLVQDLFERTSGFPVRLRHTLSERILRLALDGLECVVEAQDASLRFSAVRQMSVILDKIRLLLRVSNRLGPLDHKAYEVLSEQVDELGRMVGGWMAAQTHRGAR